MTKVKQKLYEHRFGLFFFGFLMCFGLFFTSGFFSSLEDSLVLSIYVVDFSVGFATRLLPGAIYKIFVGEYSLESATVFFYVTLVACYAGIAVLSEKLLKAFDKKNKAKGFIIVMLFLSIFCITATNGIAAYLLDLHWFIAVIVFFVCLSNKRLYWLIPVTFIYAIMCHYACVLCYIPMFVLIMLYKIIICENKVEKKHISTVLTVSLILSVSLFVYMVIFETDNMKYTMEEFTQLLTSNGIKMLYYYVYPFYRDAMEAPESIAAAIEAGSWIEVDATQPIMIRLFNTILQQIQSAILLGGAELFIFRCVIFLPVIVYLLTFFIKKIKIEKENKPKQFICFCSVGLFFFAVLLGTIFSTDLLRWTGHATLATFLILVYLFYSGKKEEREAFDAFGKLPMGMAPIYLVLTMLTILG